MPIEVSMLFWRSDCLFDLIRGIKNKPTREWTCTHLNEIKSFSLTNVITRLASSFGTGNSAFRIPTIRSPSLLPKASKIKCGYCSETVLDALVETSCRSTTLWSVMESVGPCGRCETMSASGTPRVSWTKRRSVMFWARQVWRRSRRTVFPLLRR